MTDRDKRESQLQTINLNPVRCNTEQEIDHQKENLTVYTPSPEQKEESKDLSN